MDELLLRLFSRKQLDRDAAAEQLAFLLEYGGGVFRPNECGGYEPFKPFDPSAFERYVSWLLNPGGEFGFRRSPSPVALEGRITNLLPPEIFVGVEGSHDKQPLPIPPPPVFCTRWSLQIDRAVIELRGPEFMKDFLIESSCVARADYGFVATVQDYRNRHFLSVRQGISEVQNFVGDDPGHGIPGLYWMNLVGPIYVDWFGKGKLVTLARHMETVPLSGGALYLRFGRLPEESEVPSALEQQQTAIQILGETAFFDIRRPERLLDVPPGLTRSSYSHD